MDTDDDIHADGDNDIHVKTLPDDVTDNIDIPVKTLHCNVFTDNNTDTISPKPGSLPVIIRSYKSICTKIINQQYSDSHFAWQPRFHDRIIRNDDELRRIRFYIANNPAQWTTENDDAYDLNH